MPDCFIICPIGETGSEIRRNADDLRDLIIQRWNRLDSMSSAETTIRKRDR